MAIDCKFCGSRLDENFTCKICNYKLEERICFTGYHFYFMKDVLRDRNFKTLPFPTRKERCENCVFKLKIIDKHISRKTGKICDKLHNFEYEVCYLAPMGYCYDTNSILYLLIKNSSTCNKFKKRKAKYNTKERIIKI